MRTYGASASGSVYTATEAMPSSCAARMMRIAISPRLAIITFLMGVMPSELAVAAAL